MIMRTILSLINARIEIYRMDKRIESTFEYLRIIKVIIINTSPRLTLDKRKSSLGFLILTWMYSAMSISHFSRVDIKFPTLVSTLHKA